MKRVLGITSVVLVACSTEEVSTTNFDGSAGCVYLDGGFQNQMSVQGYELPDADVISQACWDEDGRLYTFEGKSLELPIDENWSFTVFLREDVYTPASLRGNLEQSGDTYNVAGCEIELSLDVGRSRWIGCDLTFNMADGSATLGFAETSMVATATWMSEN